MPLRNWITSANHAIEGIIYAARTQRHVRYHLVASAVVLLTGFLLGVTRVEFILLSLCAITVILAEMLNTTIEKIVDKLSPETSEFAKTVKDMAAGAVLVSAVGAAFMGYVILFPYFKKIYRGGPFVRGYTREDIAVISIVMVLILVIILKAYTRKGTPLRGGFPSGHAAIAFSIWLSITFIIPNILVSLLTLVLAIVVSQSRVAVHAHTAIEVIAGAVLGLFVTGLLFLLFS